MSIKVKEGGVLRTITGMKIKAGGIVRTIKTVKVMVGGVLETVATFVPAISLSASPNPTFGTGNSLGTVACITPTVTASVSGGQGPYTYAWTQTGGPSASIYSPSTASTKFAMGLGPGSSESAQFTCTVTDAIGQTAQAVVFANFANISGA